MLLAIIPLLPVLGWGIAAGVAALFGGPAIASSLEAENRRKQAALDRYRAQVEEENRKRAEELKSLALMTDANAKLLKLETILKVERRAEQEAVQQWGNAKKHMRDLKRQRGKVRGRLRFVKIQIERYKEKKSRFLFIFRRRVDFSCDAFVGGHNKELHQLKVLQGQLKERILTFAETKNRIFASMQDRNRQRALAVSKLKEFQRGTSSFKCDVCGCQFDVPNMELVKRHRNGETYPRRCSNHLLMT